LVVNSLFVGFNIRVLAVNAQGKAMLSLVFLEEYFSPTLKAFLIILSQFKTSLLR
tara:strand:- start:2546 stop:2710 length:165 start_codon:yes stop_codon:yes gene_type:complete